jgi:L-aspartate oxidase
MANNSPAGARAGGGIVIVGSGLAALFTALKLAPDPVTIVSAAGLGEGAASAWAQGGIAAAVGEADRPEAHAADTIRAGAGIVDEAVARRVTAEAPERIEDLLALGVPFDRDDDGKIVLSREAAHSQKRVVRVTGDRAGQAIVAALIAAVRRTPSITVLEGYRAIDLVRSAGRVIGVAMEQSDDPGALRTLTGAGAVVLATGGIGGLYAVTTNPPHARGEGLGMAARAGAVLADCEFVQFHPTAVDVGIDPAPLATEALRGEGAVLINKQGRRFMSGQHPDAELAPRDVVARAVFREVEAGRGAFLDCREAVGARFPEAFPTVYAHCRAAGLDPVREPIPVAPAAHYHMGGIKTDHHGRTTVPRLWAAGEVASSGLHGANRLASNSLLEAVVFGARVAEDVKRAPRRQTPLSIDRRARPRTADPDAESAAIGELRAVMARDVGVVREERGLKRALAALAEIETTTQNDPSLLNAVIAARLIATSALRREESRGSHYRSDFPEPRGELRRRSFITLAEVTSEATP